MSILKTIFDAADNHAADTGEFDHAVGDLQDVVRAFWAVMTPTQRIAAVKSSEVAAVLESGAEGDADVLVELEMDDINADAPSGSEPEFIDVGAATSMPGAAGGFTMCAFKGQVVPEGARLYVRATRS